MILLAWLRSGWLLGASILVIGVLGCGAKAVVPEKPDDPPPAAATASAVEPVLLGSLAAHQVGDVYLAGQPAVEDIAAMRAKGVVRVISLRVPDEEPFNEASAIEAAGIDFTRIGFIGAGELTDEIFDQVRAALNDEQQRPVVLHCASANRVGAVWLAHRVLDDGLPLDQSIEEARTIGLRSSALQEAATSYIRSR